MEPSIKDGSVVLVEKITHLFRAPKVNEVVLFKFQNKTFIKRISSEENNSYYMTGDNYVDSLDSGEIGKINRGDILGKVIYF